MHHLSRPSVIPLYINSLLFYRLIDLCTPGNPWTTSSSLWLILKDFLLWSIWSNSLCHRSYLQRIVFITFVSIPIGSRISILVFLSNFIHPVCRLRQSISIVFMLFLVLWIPIPPHLPFQSWIITCNRLNLLM